MITTFHPEFISRHAAAIQLYEKANKRLGEGDADDTLTAARKCLEFFIKDFCSMFNLPIYDEYGGKPKSIEDLINTLTVCCFLTTDESAVLHRLRKLGNVGSHDFGNMQEAYAAMDLLEEAIIIFAEKEALASGMQKNVFYTYDDSGLSTRTRAISKSPIRYQRAAQSNLLPIMIACYFPFVLAQASKGILPLMLSMAVVIVCVILHGKILANFNTIPIPPEKYSKIRFTFSCKTWKGIANLCPILALPVLVTFLIGLSTLYTSGFAKVLIWVTAILCVFISPALGNLFRMVFRKKC